MSVKTRNLLIVAIISALVGICSIIFAQQPTTNNAHKDKVVPFSDFRYTDIGAATKSGYATVNEDGLKIVAGGFDIWGRHDEFHFGYKKIAGDFDLSAQMLTLSAANQYTKAGIMARTDLSDSSQHVYFQIFPDNSPRNKNNGGCEFQYRSEKGSEMKAVYPDPITAGDQFNVTFPKTWIRLKRRGDVFESYFSNDNKRWRLYSTFTLEMPRELLVGLAVTAHTSIAYTTAKFASVRLKK